MRREDEGSRSAFAVALGVDVDVSSPRSLRVCGNRRPVAEESRDVSVSVSVCGVENGWRDRDILFQVFKFEVGGSSGGLLEWFGLSELGGESFGVSL